MSRARGRSAKVTMEVDEEVAEANGEQQRRSSRKKRTLEGADAVAKASGKNSSSSSSASNHHADASSNGNQEQPLSKKEKVSGDDADVKVSSKPPGTNSADPFRYMPGFGSFFSSEKLPGALPVGQNNPQRCPYGLFAEQLNGSAFTAPRTNNFRTWFYRIMPSCVHKPFEKIDCGRITTSMSQAQTVPNQTRWKPFPLAKPDEVVDWVQGLATVGGAGSPDVKHGFAIHVYTANAPMVDKCFCNSDGDLLIVPQLGALSLQTEMGWLFVPPTEIVVVPRGIKFRVELPDVHKLPERAVRGYVLEVYDGHFKLPDLGPIGANGLANPRDFVYPVADFEDRKAPYTLIQKFLGEIFSAQSDRSPFDVVAWHGNYAPYKYNLSNFVVVNSVSVDHLDPSIFTVLTCPTLEPGVACADFVIFPPRWAVQKHTFRPPYYHRNCMSEFMGNIEGAYDAKPDGFLPGSGSLHSCMTGHGPDATAFKNASDTSKELKPVYMENALAFMFESSYIMRLTHWATEFAQVDDKYYKCWQGIEPSFDPSKP